MTRPYITTGSHSPDGRTVLPLLLANKSLGIGDYILEYDTPSYDDMSEQDFDELNRACRAIGVEYSMDDIGYYICDINWTSYPMRDSCTSEAEYCEAINDMIREYCREHESEDDDTSDIENRFNAVLELVGRLDLDDMIEIDIRAAICEIAADVANGVTA